MTVELLLYASPFTLDDSKPLRSKLFQCVRCGCSGYQSPQAERLAQQIADREKLKLEPVCSKCETKRKPEKPPLHRIVFVPREGGSR